MKYGVREICEVVMRAKDTMTLGTKKFYKNEPVLYFDTLKTSSLEGSSTTVYAQGGRGNARLMSWDGEKTTTFTMEDALISAEGLMILAGAELIAADSTKKITQHITTRVSNTTDKITVASKTLTIDLGENPTPVDVTKDNGDCIYVMLSKDGEIISEPYIATKVASENKITVAALNASARKNGAYAIVEEFDASKFDAVVVDYYTEYTDSNVKQINITPDSFGGAFYLEASTLFRNEDGIDIPAEFIIPNCRIQSNFNFSMSGSGDPSTFTFTVDAFPDYTRWDTEKKVLAAIQLIPSTKSDDEVRSQTDANGVLEKDLEPAG